jgi:hypothetical protein
MRHVTCVAATPCCASAGVEYISSRRLYEGLPEEEKKFWHSHVYEVSMHCNAICNAIQKLLPTARAHAL